LTLIARLPMIARLVVFNDTALKAFGCTYLNDAELASP